MPEQPPEPAPLPPPPAGSMPPPIPAPIVGYASPNAPAGPAPQNVPQKVFDTVTGPNLRLKDNLIQLACVIVGGGAGAIIGGVVGGSGPAIIGGIVGLFAALLLSGVVIGTLRFAGAIKR
jgi:hypothetical protein